jgi:hypothetical protein
VVTRSVTQMVLDCWNTGITVSNLARDMDACPCFSRILCRWMLCDGVIFPPRNAAVSLCDIVEKLFSKIYQRSNWAVAPTSLLAHESGRRCRYRCIRGGSRHLYDLGNVWMFRSQWNAVFTCLSKNMFTVWRHNVKYSSLTFFTHNRKFTV